MKYLCAGTKDEGAKENGPRLFMYRQIWRQTVMMKLMM